MDREDFNRIVGEALDALPEEFRARIQNVAILVEDAPANQSAHPKQLLLGIFHGVPMTRRSMFDLYTGPSHIVLYQKNIEAVCSTDDEIRQQIRMTVIHELGHYFGMSEEQLRGV
ncbi:MAG TPA: metallopeptidase family protein [Terriglobales bacterium]|nr:metallopeptidase family protein [Terriglobales bacterium]